MENITLTQYSLKEKYLKIEPEGRIRRYQYFVRGLVPGIIFGLSLMFLLPMISMFILGIFGFDGFEGMMMVGIVLSILTNLLYILIFYRIGLSIITKRSHDFGSDGKLATNVFKAQIIATVLSTLILALSLFGISMGSISSITNILVQIISVAGLVMWIILLFRPGNKGDNQYGKDPINTKVSFLG